ncbi:hypothetical protein V8J36_19425 [Frigidibacter sp. MR17.14]|uniref:hypothetical protein n=1 Tax=Frigidibacter sp. MR17.14 TaxID=3126509 RepID=UPI003012D819
MQVVFHLGAHCTDEDRLVRGLQRGRVELAEVHTVAPPPARYRAVLRETLVKLRGQPASREIQDVILDAVMDDDRAERVIFSHEFFLCIPRRVVAEGAFYGLAGKKAAALANLFPEAQVEFHLAMRNPATLVPALLSRLEGVGYGDFMEGMAPQALRWLPVIEQIVDAVPRAKVVTWCNEDTPLIWPEVLHGIAALPAEVPLAADHEIAQSIMTPEGVQRMRAYLDQHRPVSAVQRRKIVSAFLGKFGREDEIEVEVALPGWDAALIEEITALYDADCATIATMPGVSFLAP